MSDSILLFFVIFVVSCDKKICPFSRVALRFFPAALAFDCGTVALGICWRILPLFGITGAMRILAALLIASLFVARGAASSPVTFNRQIAPIIYQNCSSCHRPGKAAPFSLLSYENVAKKDFHPTGKPEAEKSLIGLYFAKQPPQRTLTRIQGRDGQHHAHRGAARRIRPCCSARRCRVAPQGASPRANAGRPWSCEKGDATFGGVNG